LNKNLH